MEAEEEEEDEEEISVTTSKRRKTILSLLTSGGVSWKASRRYDNERLRHLPCHNPPKQDAAAA